MNLKDLLDQVEVLESEKRFLEMVEVLNQIISAAESERVATECPPLTELRQRQAGAYYRAGEYDEAIDILERLRHQGETAELLSLLAPVYLEAGRFQDVVETGHRVLAIDPYAISVKKVVGRAYMNLGEQAGTSGADHWQNAIDQFTDILVKFNPNDELVRELKVRCVTKRDNSFGDTMRSRFWEFTNLAKRHDWNKASRVFRELVRIVIEHAFDVQEKYPLRTVDIVQDFIKLVVDFDEKSRINLTSQMGVVLAQLRSLEMWSYLRTGDFGKAELALDKAIRAAPEDTLPWTSKAEFSWASNRPENDTIVALERAESLVRDQCDRYRMAATHYLLGKLDKAMISVDKIDIEKLKAEAYRPDRAEAIVIRLRTEIEDRLASGITQSPEELRVAGDSDHILKSKLSG